MTGGGRPMKARCNVTLSDLTRHLRELGGADTGEKPIAFYIPGVPRLQYSGRLYKAGQLLIEAYCAGLFKGITLNDRIGKAAQDGFAQDVAKEAIAYLDSRGHGVGQPDPARDCFDRMADAFELEAAKVIAADEDAAELAKLTKTERGIVLFVRAHGGSADIAEMFKTVWRQRFQEKYRGKIERHTSAISRKSSFWQCHVSGDLVTLECFKPELTKN